MRLQVDRSVNLATLSPSRAASVHNAQNTGSSGAYEVPGVDLAQRLSRTRSTRWIGQNWSRCHNVISEHGIVFQNMALNYLAATVSVSSSGVVVSTSWEVPWR